MFVVSLSYICELDEVEKHLQAHLDYLDKYYADGTFIVSGRKVPRAGGVILARAESTEALKEILAEDPFHIHNVATYDINEFVVTKASEKLDFLIDESH